MKTKNKATYIIFLFMVLCMVSCSDFLDRLPYDKKRLEDLNDEEKAELASGLLFDTYAGMRAFGYSSTPYLGIFSIRSDDAEKGSTPTDSPNISELDNFTFTPSNGAINNFYQTAVGLTERATKSIEFADSLFVNPEDQSAKELVVAESRFLRGLLYFDLVRCYGGMPIVDKITADTAVLFNRKSVDETYNFIEQDFQYAIGILPLKSGWSSSWAGRATQGAAQAYLAKVYLYRGKWQEAYNMAKAVIESNQYNLSTPYNQIWTESKENGPESIFEIQCSSIQNYSDISSEWAQSQGIRGNPELDLGLGLNVPGATLLAAYEPNDPRKKATIITAGETLEDGQVVPKITGRPNYYNKKAYSWKDERTAHPTRPYGGWINIRLMRYSDVVLIAAEAAVKIGTPDKIDEALTYLEMVRARARGTDSSILPKVTTTDPNELMSKIQQERRIEFALESERYFDLVRWGLAETVLAPKWKKGKHEYLPIPSLQIIKSNYHLTQNPGY